MKLRPRFIVAMCLACAGAATPSLRGQTARLAQPAPLVSFDVMDRSIEDLQRALEAGEITSRRLVDLYLARIEAYDKQGPALNAIVTLNPRAREAADALD